MTIKHSLEIKNLIFFVNLGMTEKEIFIPQKISLNIIFIFTEADWSTDNLQNKICYDNLIQEIQNLLIKNKYNTVEYLTKQVYLFLTSYAQGVNELDLTITKLNPPISNENGGVTFRIKGVL